MPGGFGGNLGFLAEADLEPGHRGAADAQGGGGLFEGCPQQGGQQDRLTASPGVAGAGGRRNGLGSTDKLRITPAGSGHSKTLPLFISS